MGTKYGYIRASTEDQRATLITQEESLRKVGCAEIFMDDAETGKTNMTKEGTDWMRLLSIVKDGDQVVVKSHTRLGRKNHQIIYAVGELIEQGVSVWVLEDNRVYDNLDDFSQVINLNINSAFSDRERVETSTRTSGSLQYRKANGYKLGTPPRLSRSHVAYIKALHEQQLGIRSIAAEVKVFSKKHEKEMPISTSTVQKVLKGTYGMTREDWQAKNEKAKSDLVKVAEAKRRVRVSKTSEASAI